MRFMIAGVALSQSWWPFAPKNVSEAIDRIRGEVARSVGDQRRCGVALQEALRRRGIVSRAVFAFTASALKISGTPLLEVRGRHGWEVHDPFLDLAFVSRGKRLDARSLAFSSVGFEVVPMRGELAGWLPTGSAHLRDSGCLAMLVIPAKGLIYAGRAAEQRAVEIAHHHVEMVHGRKFALQRQS